MSRRRGLPGLYLLIALAAAPVAAQFAQTEVSAGAAPPFRLVKTGGGFEDFSSQGAVSYNIYRRQPGDGFRCLVQGLGSNSWPGGDPGSPVNQAWWYAVNASDGTSENRHGSSIGVVRACSGQVRVRVNACPSLIPAGGASRIRIEVDNRGGIADLAGCTLIDEVNAGGCLLLRGCASASPPLADLVCDVPTGTVTASGFTVPAGAVQVIELDVTGGAATASCLNRAAVVCGSRAGSASGVLNVLAPVCTPLAGRPPLRLVRVATGFASQTTHLTSAPLDRRRLFVTQQVGLIRVIQDGIALSTPFLDIVSLVNSVGIQGLMSVAFHPGYVHNGRFFVFYTAPGTGGGSTITVAEYRVSAGDPNTADPASARVLLTIDHPPSDHNGGQLAFSPCDGYLYVSTGDGGAASDPGENAESLRSRLGKVLRIDVDGDCAPAAYCIPPDNPFLADPLAVPEIWAYGLRNPWRMGFDRASGDLYIGDVGQVAMEEIDVQPASSRGGENYGWDWMEGSLCHEYPGCAPGTPAPDPVGVLPTLEYPHPEGVSVIGGLVYRGCRLAGYSGTYFYADYGGLAMPGFVRSFEYVGGAPTNPLSWPEFTLPGWVRNPSSLGEDADGELYILNLGGTVFKISD